MRDLPFNDAGEIDYKDSAAGITGHASAGAKAAAAVDAAAQSRVAEDEAKHKGMEAVRVAKRDLLKHSLEMMVKQELCSADHAARLFERAVRGDVLVDAAIEAYASDKDVVEFLDTLQILANNTPEQLDAMLRSAVRMSDSEVAAGMAQRPASAAGGPRPGHTSSASSQSSTAAVRGGDTSTNSSLKSSSSPVSSGPTHEEPYTSPSGVVYTTAQRALRGIVVQLGQEGVLPSEAADMLLTMIREKDAKILAIYTKFQTGHDAGELIQALMRLSLSQMEEQLESHKHALNELNQQVGLVVLLLQGLLGPRMHVLQHSL